MVTSWECSEDAPERCRGRLRESARSSSTLPTSRTAASSSPGTRAGSSSSPDTHAGRAGPRPHHATTSHDRFWRAETVRGARGVARPAAARLGAPPPSTGRPAERAGGAEFGHIALDAPAGAEGRVLADALAAHRRSSARTSRDALDGRARASRSPARPGRHRLAHPGPPARRPRRPGRPVRRPLAHASSRSTTCRSATEPVGDARLRPDVRRRRVGGCRRDLARRRARPGERCAGRSAGAARPAPARPVPIRERVGDREFRLDARGFWQVHRGGGRRRSPRRCSPPSTRRCSTRDAANLDLYGGVGPARRRARRTGSADAAHHDGRDPTSAATRRRRREPRRLASGAAAVTARVERSSPPRRRRAAAERARCAPQPSCSTRRAPAPGARSSTRSPSLAPAQIVYVACDPVALARDLATFAGHGYRAATLRAFDLFPNTHHVEAVAR